MELCPYNELAIAAFHVSAHLVQLYNISATIMCLMYCMVLEIHQITVSNGLALLL